MSLDARETPGTEQDRIDFLGLKVANLSLVELGLGSLIHGLKIPLGGNFLSLYQTFFLTRSSIEAKPIGLEKRSPYLISGISSVLKSLSPAGARLGPMLAISVQGLLFSLGVFAFGAQLVGYLVGAVLAGLWAFLQPFLTYFLFFGTDLARAVTYFVTKVFPFHVIWLKSLIVAVIGLKIALSVLSVTLAYRWIARIHPLEARMLLAGKGLARQAMTAPKRVPESAWRLALRDLCRPLFLISLAMTCAFVYYTQNDATHVWIYALRPVSVGFLFFYLSRSAVLLRWLSRFEGTTASAARSAIRELRRVSDAATGEKG
jgi:hypothetical protein